MAGNGDLSFFLIVGCCSLLVLGKGGGDIDVECSNSKVIILKNTCIRWNLRRKSNAELNRFASPAQPRIHLAAFTSSGA